MLEHLTNAVRELRNAGEAVKANDQHLAREIDAGADVINRLRTHATDLRRPTNSALPDSPE